MSSTSIISLREERQTFVLEFHKPDRSTQGVHLSHDNMSFVSSFKIYKQALMNHWKTGKNTQIMKPRRLSKAYQVNSYGESICSTRAIQSFQCLVFSRM